VKIAVLGGGNGSFAAAADLTEQGHEVRLWRRDRSAIDAMRNNGSIVTLKDFNGERHIPLSLVTHDLQQAVNGVALIVCPTPANAQVDIAKGLAPHLVDAVSHPQAW